jgi:hypothetical protein
MLCKVLFTSDLHVDSDNAKGNPPLKIMYPLPGEGQCIGIGFIPSISPRAILDTLRTYRLAETDWVFGYYDRCVVTIDQPVEQQLSSCYYRVA